MNDDHALKALWTMFYIQVSIWLISFLIIALRGV